MKRFLDLLISFILIVALLPVSVPIILIIKFESKGDFYFIQERLGYRGKVFRLYKFRSMYIGDHDKKSQVFLDHPSITRFGRWMRRFKIDEIPQLINIFIGDMSLVGPRPCLPELAEKFDANGKKRNNVKPGLTGLAQVNGNIFLSWQKRWEYDAYYVENKSLLLDFKILYLTLKVLIKGENRF